MVSWPVAPDSRTRAKVSRTNPAAPLWAVADPPLSREQSTSLLSARLARSGWNPRTF